MLDGKDAEKALSYGSDYARLDGEVLVNDKKVPIRRLLGKDAFVVAMARDQDSGHHVAGAPVRREKVLRAKDTITGRSDGENDYKTQQKRREAKERLQAKINAAAIAAAVDQAELLGSDKVLPWIIQGYARRSGE